MTRRGHTHGGDGHAQGGDIYTRSDIHNERLTYVREIHTEGTCTWRGNTPGRDMHAEGT